MNSLKRIKKLFDKLDKEGNIDGDKYIKEESFKHKIFLNFFKELGYSEKEIKIEVGLTGENLKAKKKADVVCEDILLEVKSSNKKLSNSVLNQVFLYNSVLSKKIIGVTNFKEFKFFKISSNNLILDFNINEIYEDNKYYILNEIIYYLGKYSYANWVDFASDNIKMKNFYSISELIKKSLNIFKEYNYLFLPLIEFNDNYYSLEKDDYSISIVSQNENDHYIRFQYQIIIKLKELIHFQQLNIIYLHRSIRELILLIDNLGQFCSNIYCSHNDSNLLEIYDISKSDHYSNGIWRYYSLSDVYHSNQSKYMIKKTEIDNYCKEIINKLKEIEKIHGEINRHNSCFFDLKSLYDKFY